MSYADDLTDFEATVVDLAKFLATASADKRVTVTAEVQRRLRALERAMGEQLDDAVFAFVRDWKFPDLYRSTEMADDEAYRQTKALEAAQRLIDKGVSNHSPHREIQDRPARTTPSMVTVMAHYDRGEQRANDRERHAKWEAEHAAKEDAERARLTAEANAALTEAPGWSIFDADTGHRIGPATVEQVEAAKYATGAKKPPPATDGGHHALPYLERIASSSLAHADTINGFPVPKPTTEIPVLIRTAAGVRGHPARPDPEQPVGRVTEIGWHYEWVRDRQGRKLVTRPVNPTVLDYEQAVFVRPQRTHDRH